MPTAYCLGKSAAEVLLGDCTQEQVGLLNQQATTVTGLAVCVDPTAVGHAGQGLNGCLQKGMTGFALHMGNQAETTVILEFVGVVQTCFHRHFLTRLPQKGANFFSIQPLASRAERTPAWQGQKGGHSTHRQKRPQIWRRTVNSCRIYERFKAIACASQNIFDV
jgi:hypothetical protein